ncbi:hypothetical protein VTG60DRAFT_1194 [Thermothelomyces hinnuleus]
MSSSDIQLLQASIDPEGESDFRILVDNTYVKYLTIDAGIYDPEDMAFGPSLISLLPPLPPGNWNIGHIRMDPASQQAHFAFTSSSPLPAITNIWHHSLIDHLELRLGRKLRSNIYEAACPRFDDTVIVKFARFPFEIALLEKETTAYQWIDGHQIGPTFLGHLTEEGRVIGFVMERVGGGEFRHATADDLGPCCKVLGRLHRLGIMHGDINKHNFLVHSGGVTMIDFDCAKRGVGTAELEEELRGLERQLRDESGRGGRVVESGSG